jgi:molecular chaperone DnaK
VLEVGDGVVEVKATSGDTHLGGDDWDEVIVDWLISEFKKDTAIDLRNDRQALQRLKESAEKAKIELSSMVQTEISLPFITANANGPQHLNTSLSRAKFEQLSAHLLQRIEAPVHQALKDAGLSKTNIQEVVLVGGSTRMPMVQDLVERLLGKAPNKSVNPDEVVAVGAALQAGVLAGDVKDILLLDVTPLSLGLETLGGVMTALIPRNTTIPVRKTEVFSTAVDNQTAVDVAVYQGERPMAQDNMSLGQFRLDGIPSAPRGVPQVEVTFDIDANGILNVSARDKASGKEQKITITASTNLSNSDVDRMVREAEQNRANDERRADVAKVRNEADSLIYQTEKSLMTLGDKVNTTDRAQVENLMNDLREAINREDINAIRNGIQNLESASHALSQQVYANQNPNNPDNVVEGQYTEV